MGNGLAILGALILMGAGAAIYSKNAHIWIGSYILRKIGLRRFGKANHPTHIIFCMVDHFEPIQQESTYESEERVMVAWEREYTGMAKRHHDSNGRIPQHTWFYPGEAYKKEYLDRLTSLCREGYGEVELHHHHHNETSDGLRQKLVDAIEQFQQHGLLQVNMEGESVTCYGFIHGNMALDNSRYDPQWCGVNDELTILKDTGCYADFSSPTAPCRSQPKRVNSIYYAQDDPHRPKSHNDGTDVSVGGQEWGHVMIIQGPLALNWKDRKYGIFPRIDNGEILRSSPGTRSRIVRWVNEKIHVIGMPSWIFVKVSCHGGQEENLGVLVRKQADEMFTDLENLYKAEPGYRLHYVTAREMYNIVKAAEAGMKGDPNDYRNFILPPYRYNIS